MHQTMRDLFTRSGYSNYRELPIDTPIVPKTKIEVKSWDKDSNQLVWKKVEALFYKGESSPEDTYEVLIPTKNKSFLCTGNHCIYELTKGLFVPVCELFKKEEQSHISIDENGDIVGFIVCQMNESFSILDVQVEGTSCYFSAGILSHNSFGSAAKLFSEGLRKFNPYLSHYSTSLQLINQTRDAVGQKAMPGMPKPESQPGGQAIKFYASWRGRISQGEPIMHLGEQIGNKIKIKNQKNKVGVPKRSTEMELLYASGFNPDLAYVDFIIQLGLVNVKGSWYSNPDWGITSPGLNGQAKLFEFLVNNRDVFEEAKARVNETFMSYNILDVTDTTPDLLTEMEALETIGAGSEE